MRVLRTVIEVPVLAVLHPRQHFLLRGAVAFQLVGNDDPWHVRQPFQQFTEKLLRCLFISTALYQNIQDVAILIDSPPQVMPLTVNGEKHLIEVPLVTGSGPPMPECIRIGLTELSAPLPDGFIGHGNPPGEQEFFDIAVAETEAEVQPDAVADDLVWKTVILVAVVGSWCLYAASMPHLTAATTS